MKLDLEGMEKRLSVMNERSIFIEPNMKITNDEVQILRSFVTTYGKYNFENCIGSFSRNPTQRQMITVETHCKECKEIVFEKLGRGAFIDYITKKEYVCDSCKHDIKQKQNKQYKEFNENYEKERAEQTEIYIERYLDPCSKWNDNVSFNEKYKIIFSTYFIREVIFNHVKSMDYYDYLKTPQWKVVAEKKKRQSRFKCELCNASGFIAVHHKTYEHKGIEMDNLKDLIVLCDDCHKKFHDIEE